MDIPVFLANLARSGKRRRSRRALREKSTHCIYGFSGLRVLGYRHFNAFARIQSKHGVFVNTVTTACSDERDCLNFIQWNVYWLPMPEERYQLYSGAAGGPVEIAMRTVHKRHADLKRKPTLILFDDFHEIISIPSINRADGPHLSSTST